MSDQPNESVELDIDDEKVEAWDEVKGDYLVDPAEGQGGGDASGAVDKPAGDEPAGDGPAAAADTEESAAGD